MSRILLYSLFFGMALQVLALQVTAVKRSTVTIRSIDFKNFTYPLPNDLLAPNKAKKTFHLTNGELPARLTREGRVKGLGVFFGHIVYADVTGDGIDEAIIKLGIQSGGSALPGIVYVYSIKGKQPKPLWYFSTGDRAYGGFRRAYAEQGKLVIELNDPRGNRGDCCPTQYRRTQYKWSGNQFQKKRQEILLLNEKGQ